MLDPIVMPAKAGIPCLILFLHVIRITLRIIRESYMCRSGFSRELLALMTRANDSLFAAETAPTVHNQAVFFIQNLIRKG